MMFPGRLLAVLTIMTGWMAALPSMGGEPPRNIILFIGDGMGMNHVQAAGMRKAANEQRPPAEGRLVFEEFPVTGYLTTHAANTVVTDSAAAGTALACGVKTRNGVVGKGADGKDVDSIAVGAKQAGKAVGIVTSVAMDDATPACFYGHVGSRGERDKLMQQAFAAQHVDVLMGGGVMCPGWNDERFAKTCGAAGMCYLSNNNLAGFKPSAAGGRRVLGYFDANGSTMLNPMDGRTAADPEPRLTTMTRKAMEVLASRSGAKGFFMMVEGGAIDKYAHGNDGVRMLGEVLELNQAVMDAMAFLKETNQLQQTLIVVTADHETGGLVLAENSALNKAAQEGNAAMPASIQIGKIKASWTSNDHTCAWVPVFAVGPEAARFAGRHDNTEVAKIIRETMN